MTEISSRIRAVFDTEPEITVEEIRAAARRRKRSFRVLGAGGGVVALAAASVAILLVVRGPAAHKVIVEPAIPPRAGMQEVGLNGIQVAVPAAWPVLGGNNTPICDGSWPANPTVYLGVQPEASISCAAQPNTPAPRQFNGVWLQPQTAATPGLSAYQLPSGQEVQETTPYSAGPGTNLLFHGVWVFVGQATSAAQAQSILASLAYHPNKPDTSASLSCATNPAYNQMPAPQRLTHQMIIEYGNITLDPPHPGDRASVPASIAWNGPQGSLEDLPTNTYQLFLARYSAKFPATVQPNGSTVPEEQSVLAWVLYATPLTSTNHTCGSPAVSAYDAHTGQRLSG
ncbi:MAG: hypothetical protein KGQ66_18840 [Acidobacteriota bacterium]|nr:hypothetical protein [Acidobacteriota bacterium]